jgi:hypothetical protein
METKTFTRDVEFALSESEMLMRGRRLAELTHEKGVLLEDKKASSEKFKEREKNLDREGSELARAIRSGKEHRPVLCSERANVTRKLWEVIREDTYTVIDSRPMSHREVEEAMQGGLPLDDHAPRTN